MYDFLNKNIGEVMAIVLTSIIAIFIISTVHIASKHTQIMADKGYVQVQRIGSSDTLWMKESR